MTGRDRTGSSQCRSQVLRPGRRGPGIIDTEMLRSCFGADAGNYPDPAAWAEKAVPFLLGLGPKDNGKPMEVPE